MKSEACSAAIVAESGVPGFDEGGHHGIVAPSGVPKGIIAKLNGDIVTAMRAPEIVNRLRVERLSF